MSDIDGIIVQIEREQDQKRLKEMTWNDRKSFDRYTK